MFDGLDATMFEVEGLKKLRQRFDEEIFAVFFVPGKSNVQTLSLPLEPLVFSTKLKTCGERKIWRGTSTNLKRAFNFEAHILF